MAAAAEHAFCRQPLLTTRRCRSTRSRPPPPQWPGCRCREGRGRSGLGTVGLGRGSWAGPGLLAGAREISQRARLAGPMPAPAPSPHLSCPSSAASASGAGCCMDCRQMLSWPSLADSAAS